jgi:hypothetical protein
MRRGEFKVIRVDGSEEVFHIWPTLTLVKAAIGCETIDTIRIGRNPANGSPATVMLVDDIGAGFEGSKLKPVNERATALYHSVSKPGNPHSIHGDVAIVNNEDFA